MHSWEVLCIEIEEDSHFDDCRAISKIGYKAPTLRKNPRTQWGREFIKVTRIGMRTLTGIASN